ncbi:MAG: alanine racemase [Alphaproteobacteria bacterium]|nr:alanine racemase [Alphaproteobacteria bacterium]MBV9373287.1 alanine racemase [Alphaproteobacteria bacterium]MBV9901250.1 alanine racemase [Alphaproteobacteria bacterium]
MTHAPLRLTLDGDALVANWRWLDARSGAAACGAAVKADGYGLGAAEVTRRLAEAGCRDFFVATWAEAEEILPLLAEGASLSILHGVAEEDLAQAAGSRARPVLNTPRQVARWKEAAPGRPCDLMIDTGIGRLGLSPGEAGSGLLDGLVVDTVMSHLACADEDRAMNAAQRDAFAAAAGTLRARRLSLANSAGICLGRDYAFGLTRPGLALYGGVPRREAEGHVRQVARVEAQVVQRKRLPAGATVGYNATFTAAAACDIAILNIGYADGYLRGFSGRGSALHGEAVLPVAGRVSMDLTAVLADAAPGLREGDWVELVYDLPAASAQSGLSQYELLTTLGRRHARTWR